jgi:hypothetical protein
MHTHRTSNTTFIYNSDLSGDVVIRRGEDETQVPGTDLLAFLAHYVRTEKTSAVEQASDREILGL